jgi:hypothetical protein
MRRSEWNHPTPASSFCAAREFRSSTSAITERSLEHAFEPADHDWQFNLAPGGGVTRMVL